MGDFNEVRNGGPSEFIQDTDHAHVIKLPSLGVILLGITGRRGKFQAEKIG